MYAGKSGTGQAEKRKQSNDDSKPVRCFNPRYPPYNFVHKKNKTFITNNILIKLIFYNNIQNKYLLNYYE
jgi:hypothetical protein